MERGFRTETSGSWGGGTYVQTSAAIPASITLDLGVIDVPYANAPRDIPAQKGKRTKPIKRASGTQTTGDVAEILEAKYGVMRTFADVMEGAIATTIQESLADALENLMAGAPASNPFADGLGDIEKMFKDFLITSEVEHVGIKGVPTQAALDGVDHRLMHPYAKANPRRPSFIDTGLYLANFKCWIE